MARSMNRLHDMPSGVIEDLDERYSVGVLGQDAGGWGYITMGPDRNPDSMPSDGWGLYHPSARSCASPPAVCTAGRESPQLRPVVCGVTVVRWAVLVVDVVGPGVEVSVVRLH